MGKEGEIVKKLLKRSTVCMIVAMILAVNTTMVFASDDNRPKFPDSINPPVDTEYLIY